MNLTTWHYALADSEQLRRLPARVAEFGFRGDFDLAGAPDPSWVCSAGGIRVIAAVMVVAGRKALGVLGYGKAYLPVYQDSPSSIHTKDGLIDQARDQLAQVVAKRVGVPALAWPLREFMEEHPLPLPIRRSVQIGEATPWLVYDVWRSRVQRGAMEYFDLERGEVVGQNPA